MSEPSYSIQRNGTLFKVGNDQEGYQTFRLKVSGKEGQLDEAKLAQIADQVFSMLQDSKVTFKSLANTKVTPEGITTDQKDTGIINAQELPNFEQRYTLLTQLANTALVKQKQSRDKTVKEEFLFKPIIHRSRSVYLAKIYDFFERIFAPKKFRTRQKKLAHFLIWQSNSKVKALKDFNLQDLREKPKGKSVFAYVPKSMMTSPEEINVQLSSKRIGAQAALNGKMHQNVSPLEAGGITVKGFKINASKSRNENVRKDRIIPTSFKLIKKKRSKQNRLMNCYMAFAGERGLLRTGAVDTSEKAQEFVIAAKNLHEQLPQAAAGPIRIVSHQLDSAIGMIKNQHKQLIALSEKNVEIIHINTPCNRSYHATKPSEMAFEPEEEKSQNQNLEGMARYLVWIVEDLEKLSKDTTLSPDQRACFSLAAGKLQMGKSNKIIKLKWKINQINADLKKLQEKQHGLNTKKTEKKNLQLNISPSGLMKYFFEKAKLNAEIAALKQEVTSLKSSLTLSRKSLFYKQGEKKELFQLYTTLKDTIEGQVLSGNDAAMTKLRTTVRIYRKLLGNQYLFDKLPKSELMGRGQEMLLYQLLNQKMGVISAVNCDSGLDRTGFVFSLMMALVQEDKCDEIVLNWDHYVANLNQKMRQLNYDTEQLCRWLDEPDDSATKQIYRTIFDFRLKVLNNLLNVSLPITVTSTGLVGLKWGNLLPLNFIPPVVQMVHEDGHSEPARILNYDSKGKVTGLTKKGHRLITQLYPRNFKI